MRRNDDGSVSLNPAEKTARDLFVEWQSGGWTTPEAAVKALRRMDLTQRTDEFIDYLSHGTCRRWGQRVLIRPEVRRQIEADRKAQAEQEARAMPERAPSMWHDEHRIDEGNRP
jgi:hypothetical protein